MFHSSTFSFCQCNTEHVNYCTSFSLPTIKRSHLAQHKKVHRISALPDTRLPSFICVPCWWSYCVWRSWTASPQCQQQTTDHKEQTLNSHTNTQKKEMPNVTWDCCFFFLVQTYSCKFILESLWITGTSIWGVSEESKFVHENNIVKTVLRWCTEHALLFAGRLVSIEGSVIVKERHTWEKTCFTVSCIFI